METLVINQFDIEKIANALLAGSLVAFPTDTIYGVACVYDRAEAIEKLKAAKYRPDDKPFPMMVSSKIQIETVAEVGKKAAKIIEAWMPGALTLILKRQAHIPAFVTNGEDTIAIRMPNDEFVLKLIEMVGKPLLVTSANLSGGANTTSSDEVLDQLAGRIDVIVPGNSKGSRASTIIDVSDEANIKELRSGPLSFDRIMYSIKEDK